MTSEVEDSPNRCPRCQQVQLHNNLCQACEDAFDAITVVPTDCYIMDARDQDILDILTILSEITEGLSGEAYAERERADNMIASMREAVESRKRRI